MTLQQLIPKTAHTLYSLEFAYYITKTDVERYRFFVFFDLQKIVKNAQQDNKIVVEYLQKVNNLIF